MHKLSKQPLTLIFDFDGTIADTLLLYFSLLNALSDKFNFVKFNINNIDYYRSLSSHQIYDMLDLPKLKLPFFVYEARKVLKKEMDNIKPIQGIKDTIAKLKDDKIQLGIITSNSVKNVNHFLNNFGFPTFDFVFSSLRIWQKSVILKKVMANQKLDPEKVYYIGDETRDIEAAHEAGVKSIAVTWGYNSLDILKSMNPDFIVDSPIQLNSLFENNSQK